MLNMFLWSENWHNRLGICKACWASTWAELGEQLKAWNLVDSECEQLSRWTWPDRVDPRFPSSKGVSIGHVQRACMPERILSGRFCTAWGANLIHFGTATRTRSNWMGWKRKNGRNFLLHKDRRCRGGGKRRGWSGFLPKTRRKQG